MSGLSRRRGDETAARRDAAPEAPSGGRRSVLVVDLDGRAGTALAQPLARSWLVSHVVRDVSAALEALGRERPVAVIVAGRAPAGLHRALRQATPAPLLVLDAQADDEEMLAAFAAGVDQFQNRPIGPDEVVARVAALLRRHGGV